MTPGRSRLRRIGRLVGAVVLVLVGYLTLWPVGIDPVAWDAPPVPEATGALAPNERLQQAERLGVGKLRGPEDVAIAPDGRMFVGTDDGELLIVSPDGSNITTLGDTGGRPLGLAWNSLGHLVVADARRGLLSVDRGGAVTILSTESDGLAFGFTDDVDVAPDGRIYFTDASDKFGYGHHMDDLFEGRPHGRLLRYDPASGTTETLLSALYFANGVAVSADGSFVVVNETYRFRVRRYFISGPRQGEDEVFADGLPGYPDGISRSPRGTFWVALFTGRNADADQLAPQPFLRKVIFRLPEALRPKPQRYGLALELSESGDVLRTLHDTTGEVVSTVTSVEEVDGSLYLASLVEPLIARVAL